MLLRLILVLACLLATAFGLWRLERLANLDRVAALAERDALWRARIEADKTATEARAREHAAAAEVVAAARITHLQAMLADSESRADAFAQADRCGLSRDGLRALARP